MTDLTNEYNNIMAEVEARIQNKEDMKFIKEKINQIFMMFLEKIDNIADKYNTEIEHIMERHNKLENQMARLENSMSMIERDIYEDDSMYDFEVICPYCNHEFATEFDASAEDVQCPECKNVIELDWNGGAHEHHEGCCDHGCGHDCSGCEEDCDDEEDEIEEDDM